MQPLKLFIIHRHPTDSDLISARTHCCHPEYIKETALRFGFSCAYPQPASLAIGKPHAQGEAIIDGAKVLFYLEWNDDMTAWGLWSRRDLEEDHLWFAKILSTVSDIYYRKSKDKKQALKR